MVVGFNHISLSVADLDRSIQFYCGLLGFRQGPEFRDEQDVVTGCYLYLNQRMFLELFASKDTITPFQHYCLEVKDLQTLIDNLRSANVKTTDIFLGRSKAWIASIWDPDGHLIELNEFNHPESWIRNYLETIDSI